MFIKKLHVATLFALQHAGNVLRMTDNIRSHATTKKFEHSSKQKLRNTPLFLQSKNTLPLSFVRLLLYFYKETESVLFVFVGVLVGSIKIWSINKKEQTLPHCNNEYCQGTDQFKITGEIVKVVVRHCDNVFLLSKKLF